MNTTYETIRDAARTDNWSNRKIKDAMYAAGLNDRRDELLAELGREKGPAPQVAVAITAPVAVAVATVKKTRKYANQYANQYAGQCELTGQWVDAGEGVCLKYGSHWCVLGPIALSVCVCNGDEKKLLSAAMIAGGGEISELDHEDIAMLRDLLAACDREQVMAGCWSDSL